MREKIKDFLWLTTIYLTIAIVFWLFGYCFGKMSLHSFILAESALYDYETIQYFKFIKEIIISCCCAFMSVMYILCGAMTIVGFVNIIKGDKNK